jgi:serine/threonine-protein kinase
MPSKGDKEFCRAAVERTFASASALQKALDEQRKLEKEGALTTVDQLCIDLAILNPLQVEIVQDQLRRKVVYCPGCTSKYNVYKFRTGTGVKCKKCGEQIEIPRRYSEIQIDHERKARDDVGYETTPFLNKVIGGYKILDELGKGGMGVVFKAKQLSLDRMVALKVLPTELTRHKEYVNRFLKEAKSVGKLQHPNIIQVYDIGEADGIYFYSMEFIEGESVAGLLEKTKKPLDVNFSVRVVMQITKALAHAHRYDIIHRDVRPASIMINEEGIAKLADLGLVKDLTDPQGSIPGVDSSSGTPAYLAPEQIANLRNASPLSDIYSLGATFYRMVTGEPPFTGDNVLQIMKAILDDVPRKPREVHSQVPENIEEVILKMMARDARERYTSADELETVLGRIIKESGRRKSSKRWSLSKKFKRS